MGEAIESRESFAGLDAEDQAAVIEFLKTLQLPPEPDDEGGVLGTAVVWAAVVGGGVGAAVHAGMRGGLRVDEKAGTGLGFGDQEHLVRSYVF